MTLNVGIGFVTGRKHFQNVLRSYVNNWLEHGLIDEHKIRLHLFVAYDLKYQSTQAHDYKNIPGELMKLVDSINFYGSGRIEQEFQTLIDAGIINNKEAHLIFGEGYGKKRNAVMYFAIKNKMDRLVFIDDDEYPIATLKNEYDKIVWMGQSVVGTHIKFSPEADITHGHHCGYISPIPLIRFNKLLTESDFQQFIEAISNDIISWEKIKKVIVHDQGVTYANSEIINKSLVSEVEEVNGMKFISGANLCFNFRNFKKLPPFYNPPGARGEDTFMSTALSELKVLKVPCYTFHDGFMRYNNLLNGVLPVTFEPIDSLSPTDLKRFINATIGWIRYKPLLVYITQRSEFEAIMKDIERKLNATVPKLCKYFNTHDFDKIHHEFAHYRKNVAKHFADFEMSKNAWAKVMHSLE